MTTWNTKGKAAVITGGGSGLGLAAATMWAAHGGNVAVLDYSEDSLDVARRELGVDVLAIQTDVTDSSSVDAAIAQVLEHFGTIDAVVNCAGNSRPGPTAEVSDGDWTGVMGVHVDGAFRVCRAAFPALKESQGAIVNISSIAGTLGMPGRASYNTAKHAINGLTKSLAVEWAEHGIRVNAVAPGYIETALTLKQIGEGILDPTPVNERTPLNRWGKPSEIADCICFLATEASSYITGQSIRVDGGMSVDGNWYK